MGGFDPPPRAFQARALPAELHDRGAGPGTRTRINWVTKPAPIPLGPAGSSQVYIDDHAASSGLGPSSASTTRKRWTELSGVGGTTLNSVEPPVVFPLSSPTTSFSQSCRIDVPPFLQMVREEGVEPSSQGPKPCVLPLDDSRQWVMEGPMGTAPITRGWKPRV